MFSPVVYANGRFTPTMLTQLNSTVDLSQVKGGVISLNESPFQNYEASPAVWHHTLLLATRHR